MRHDDPTATNPFVRLTSFTCELGSNKIENFCTELLAWCLIESAAFRRWFLEHLQLPCDGPFECHTQHFFDNRRARREEEDKGYFDIVLRLGAERTPIIVEVKVWSGFGDRQLERYRDASVEMFKQATEIVTITPWAAAPKGSDRHMPWSSIENALRKLEPDSRFDALVLFADFLKHRGIGGHAMRKLRSNPPRTWVDSIGFYKDCKVLLERLRQQPRLKGVFGGRGAILDDIGPGGAIAWLGISSNSTDPVIYAGIAFSAQSDLAALWVEVEISIENDQSKHLGVLDSDAVALAQRMGHKPGDYGRNRTGRFFLQELTDAYDGNPEKMLEWFENTIEPLAVMLKLK